MAWRHLISTRAHGVERLTLNRPDVRNAFNEDVVSELRAWADQTREAAARGDVRAVVLAGAGPSFCAGADIAWMAKTIGCSEAENLRDATAAAEMFGAIDTLPVPVIGRVHGAAVGGGAGLVAVCDIAIADERTTFGFTEVRLGIVPAVISPFVVQKIGRSAARELFLTGARFTAQRAKEIGLVHAVVPPQELDSDVDAALADVLAGGPEALAAAKALIATVAELTPEAARDLTARNIAKRRVSPEGQEGLRAFLEKRKPAWSRS